MSTVYFKWTDALKRIQILINYNKLLIIFFSTRVYLAVNLFKTFMQFDHKITLLIQLKMKLTERFVHEANNIMCNQQWMYSKHN